MPLIDCDESHLSAILAIFNDAIVTSTALYDYNPRTTAMIETWFATKRQNNLPIIGMVDESGTLLGFASYGPFRAFPAYKYSVEHSVYVNKTARGKGIGKILLKEIIARAQVNNIHTLIGVIDSQNAVSIRLHEQFGFKLNGTLPQVGFKFGKWLDVVFYQLILETPATPIDG